MATRRSPNPRRKFPAWAAALAVCWLALPAAASDGEVSPREESAPAQENPSSPQERAIPETKLGYSACVWPPGQPVRVGIDPAHPFPDPAYAERLDEALARWNAALAGTARGVTLVRDGGDRPQILVQYRPTAPAAGHEGHEAADVLGETYLQRQGDPDLSPDIGRCPDRTPAAHTMEAAHIRIQPRNDWFTGPDPAVEAWERCDNEGYRVANPQLCARQVDFASTMIHEFGHALVLYHPQTLDQIDGVPIDSPESASRYARCVETTGSFAEQATLCAGQGVWRAEQRTLEPWDTATVQRQYR